MILCNNGAIYGLAKASDRKYIISPEPAVAQPVE